MTQDKRQEWMTSLSATVDQDDYLLGRKIDKTFELIQQEKAQRDREHTINLIARDKLRLTGDPILDLERRKQALKLEIMTNPIKRKQMRDFLLKNDSRNVDTKSVDRSQPRLKDCSEKRAKDYTRTGRRSRTRSPERHSRRASSRGDEHRHHRHHRSYNHEHNRSVDRRRSSDRKERDRYEHNSDKKRHSRHN